MVVLEVTTTSPFRSPTAKTFRGENPNGWPQTPSRGSYTSSGISSCPSLEFTRQSPISMYRTSTLQRPGSTQTTSTAVTIYDNPSTPPTISAYRNNYNLFTSSDSNSPPPPPPPHAVGTVSSEGLNLSKPLYAHAADSLDPWNSNRPIPDDFDLYDEIDDLLKSYKDLSPPREEEEIEKKEISNTPVVSKKGTLLDRLKSTEDYALPQEIIDNIANNDQDDTASKESISPIRRHEIGRSRHKRPISYIPAPVFNSHFSNESVDNILYASEYFAEMEKRALDALLTDDQSSSSSQAEDCLTVIRFSDPSPCRELVEKSIDERLSAMSLPDSSPKEESSDGSSTPIYKKAWRTFSKRSPHNKHDTTPANQKKKDDSSAPKQVSDTHIQQQQLVLYNPSGDTKVTSEGYICQAFINLGESLAKWVDKYAYGPRTMAWNDMPKETKEMFRYLQLPVHEISRRFHRSPESRAILLRQMLASFIFAAIFEPMLFGLPPHRVAPINEQAKEFGINGKSNAMKYKEWEHRMAEDETSTEEYKTSVNKSITHLRRYINFQLVPMLPMTTNATAKLKGTISSQVNVERDSVLSDIIARAVLLNIETKKCRNYFEYNFMPEHRTLISHWMNVEGKMYDPDRRSGGATMQTTNTGSPKIHAVVWPCLMMKSSATDFGRMLVKAKVIVQSEK